MYYRDHPMCCTVPGDWSTATMVDGSNRHALCAVALVGLCNPSFGLSKFKLYFFGQFSWGWSKSHCFPLSVKNYTYDYSFSKSNTEPFPVRANEMFRNQFCLLGTTVKIFPRLYRRQCESPARGNRRSWYHAWYSSRKNVSTTGLYQTMTNPRPFFKIISSILEAHQQIRDRWNSRSRESNGIALVPCVTIYPLPSPVRWLSMKSIFPSRLSLPSSSSSTRHRHCFQRNNQRYW